MLLEVHIPGAPVPQGRARTGSGHHTMDAASRGWRKVAVDAIGYARARARLATLDELLGVEVEIVTERPQDRPKRTPAEVWRTGARTPCAARGDVDNFAKAALDALVDARAISNDHIVTTLTVRKVYAAVGEGPGLVVRVGRVDG